VNNLFVNYGNPAAGAVLSTLNATTDQNFVQTNNQWFFTDNYELVALAAFGASLTALQVNDPTWNAINITQLYPPNLFATVPGNPNVMDFRSYPIPVPTDEQIQFQASNNAGSGNDAECVLMWVQPAGMPMAKPPQGAAGIGMMGRVRALFTVTGALTKGAWTYGLQLTFPSQLKGGTYCVMGLNIVVANGICWGLNFVRAPLVAGRKLVPGGLCEAAYGNVPNRLGTDWMGVVGYFNTFEPPQLNLFSLTTTASATYTGYMDLLYLGTGMTINQPVTLGG